MLIIFSLVRKKEDSFISRRQDISIKYLCHIITQSVARNSTQRDNKYGKIESCLVVNRSYISAYLTFGALWYELHVLLGQKMCPFCKNMHYNVLLFHCILFGFVSGSFFTR